jgi:glutamine amidotransferase
VPTLGVCVGFQMFCDRSEEGSGRGLNWINGEVLKIKEKSLEDFMPLPHMGWNKVDVLKPNDLTNGVDAAAGFYFLHSYQVVTEEDHIVATSHYGETITSIYQHRNIYGIQPHPEKSHSNGIKLLENFGKL